MGFVERLPFNLSFRVLSPLSTPQKFISASANFLFSENANPIPANSLSFDVNITWDVTSANLSIAGSCNDSLSLTQLASDILADLNLPAIPQDSLNITFEDFSIFISESANNHQYSFSAIANADANLFGHNLLNIQNLAFQLQVIDNGTKTYTANLNGIIMLMGLGFQISANIGQDTYLKINMTNMTLGKLINFFVSLVSSGMQYHFPEPWDKLASINLDALVLEFDLTNKIISVEYNASIDLEFINISSITLSYNETTTQPEQKITIALTGNFLGQTYNQQNPLSWQPLNGEPPQVPGATSKFDLRYLGIGQHITFSNPANLTTVQAVLNQLEGTMQPLPANPPNNGNMMSQLNGLKYDANSGWLLGIDCTIIDTIALGVIFNDPTLYGLHLSLSGTKAKSFAGLSFEILYRKVTDDLGEYSLQLKLPNTMRHLQLGDAQITLPVIGVDIFTNGNFNVDFGFPYNHDFSQSFAILISPVVGAGGFYLAWLDGATATQMPQVTDGSFQPVIEFGFGLDVGLGASLSVGPLSAGMSVTVLGILQGTFSYFEPTNKALPKDFFYQCQGMIGVQGRLWGDVNFCVVKASVDILIDAIASVTFECYQPTYVNVSADVNASVTIHVLFISVTHSFSAHIDQQFTLGSASAPPWHLTSDSAPDSVSAKNNLCANYLLSFADEGPLCSTRLKTSAPAWSWSNAANFCYNGVQNLSLYFAPTLSTTQTTALIIAALFIDSGTTTTTDPIATADFTKLCQTMLAWALQAYFQTSNAAALNATTIDHSDLASIYAQITASIPHNFFMKISGITDAQSQLIWYTLYLQGYLTEGGEVTSKFTPTVQLDLPLSFMTSEIETAIVTSITQWQSQALFAYQDLSNYLAANFIFTITPRPTTNNGPDNGYYSGTVFPMPSAILLTPTSNVPDNNPSPIDFSQYNTVSNSDYLQDLNEYLALVMGSGFQQKSQSSLHDKALADAANPSMAQLIFQDYFLLLIRTALQSAKNILKCYPYTIQASDTLETIATQYQAKLAAMVTLNQNDPTVLNATNLLLIQGFQLLTQSSATLTSIASAYQTGVLNTGIITSAAMQAADIANNNLYLKNLFQVGSTITLQNINYTLPTTPVTQTSLAAQFYTQANNILVLGGAMPQTTTTPLAPLTQVRITNIQFTASAEPRSKELNTLKNIAAYFHISPPDLIAFNPALSAYSITATLPPTTSISIPSLLYTVPPSDPTSVLCYFGIFNERLTLNINFSAVPIVLPQVIYTVRPNDSIFSIAKYLGVKIDALLPAIASTPLTNNVSLNMPNLAHTITANQTLHQIAATYNIPVVQLASDNQTTQKCLTADALWHIPKATITVAELLQTLTVDISNNPQTTEIPVQNISGMLNRFMLHGLCIPGPQTVFPPDTSQWATLPTSSLYALTGQQITVNNSTSFNSGGSYNFNLQQNADSVSWLSFNSGDWPMALTSTELANLSTIVQQAGAVNFTLPSPITCYKSANKTFNFQHSITWQTSLAPSYLAASNPAATQTVNPALWRFPKALLAEVQSLADQTTLTLNLATTVSQYSTTQANTSAAVNGYAWGSLFNIKVQKSKLTKGIYAINFDTAERHLLAKILNSASMPTMQLFLLYPQNASNGLISDISNTNDLQSIEVINTNLSLQTNVASCATLNNAQNFLQVLFEHSVMHGGTCYLAYRTQLQLQGLPDYLFSNSDTAKIKLLIVFFDAANVSNYHNCVITQTPINTQQQVFFATAPTLLTTRSTINPGYFGFEWDLAPAPTPDNYIGSLYHLLGYVIQQNTNFAASPPGLPLSPNTDNNGWQFKKTLPIPGFQAHVSNNGFTPLPPTSENPYTNIVLSASNAPREIQLSFTAQDIFGNQLVPNGLQSPLDINLYYTDPILGIAQWPGISCSYSFIQNTAIPYCQIWLDFSVSRYNIAATEVETAMEMLKRLKADLKQYKTIYYQLGQNDVEVNLACSIGGEITDASLTTAILIPFVSQIYTYLASLAYLYDNQQLASLIVSISSTTTWQDILTNYYVASNDLATLNQNNTNLLTSNSSINLPICYTVQYQDTLNAISALTTQAPFNQGTAIPVTQIATLNQLLDILETGTVLSIPTTPTATLYTIQAGDTLAAIAASFATENITVNDIATANAGLSQLFKQGAGIVLYTVSQTIAASNTLLTLAQMATSLQANQGQSVTAAQLMQVNSTYTLANPGQIFIPQYLSLNISSPPDGLAVAQISSSNNSLATLVDNNNAGIIDAFYANMNIVNILQTPQPVFNFNIIINGNANSPIAITPTVRTNETLNTFYTAVLNQIASAILNTNPQSSIQLTIGSSAIPLTINLSTNNTTNAVVLQLTRLFPLADFALLISPANLFKTNAYVLVPPTPINHQSKISMGSIIYQNLFQLKVTLSLSRNAKLINPDTRIPQDFIQRLTTSTAELTPHLGDAYQNQALSLQNFASHFSKVFSGWGLAKTKTKNPNSRPTLWVIPWSASNLQYQIAAGSQAFYLPPPLATNLLTYKDVSIYAYDPQTGIQPTAQNLDFTDIDLDNWAKQFLTTFDYIFSPQYLVALNNLPNGAQYLSNLLTLKQSLAKTIAASIQPVLQQQYDNPTQRLQQAQLALQERLLANLSDAYTVDSIVQYETSVTATAYTPALSLAMAAEYLDISLHEMVLASLYAPIQANIMLNLPNNPFYVTSSGPLLNLLSNDMTEGLSPDHTLPTEITNNTNLFGPQITFGLLSTQGSGASFNIPVPATPNNTLLDVVTNNTDTFQQNCNNYQFNVYYFAKVISSVSGVYPAQPVTMSDQGKNLIYNSQTTDSLEDIFNGICANATTQNVSQPSFLTFINGVQSTLTLTVNAAFTLYWQSVTYDDYAKKYSPPDLSPQLMGKPVANNYAVSQTAEKNTLATITHHFSKTNPVPALYVAGVIQDIKNIFVPGSIIKSSTTTYTTTPNDTLASVATNLNLSSLSDLINGSFPDTAFTALPIFSPGKELNLSWISYGQGYCLETVAAALKVSVEKLIHANLLTTVYPQGPENAGVAFNNYLNQLGYFSFAHDQLVGVIPAAITSNDTLLSSTAPIGVLNYVAQPESGQNLITVTNCNTLTQIANSAAFTRYPNLGYTFDECYIAHLIKDQANIFSVSSLTIGSKTCPITPSDTLATAADKFQPLSFNDFIIQLNGVTAPLNSSATFYFGWQYVTLSMMNTQNVANTLLSISLYFQCDLADLISANLNVPDLLKSGTVINYSNIPAYTIKATDTFNTLLTQLVTGWDENQLNIPDAFLNCTDIASNQTLLNPYAKISLLKEQPGTSLSSAQSSLQNGQSYLTFLFQETNEQQERVFLDLQYAISSIAFNRQPIDNMPGYFDYDTLSLLQPLSVDMNQVEIPVPLRSYPLTPVLQTQQARAYSPPQNQALDLQTAKSWTYQYSYTQQDTSQDEIEICLTFNTTAKKPPESKKTSVSAGLTEQDSSSKLSALFASLAEFITVQPLIMQSLNGLINVNTIPITNAPQITTAVEAFITLTQAVVTAWTDLYSVSSSLKQNDDQTPIQYSCTVSEYVDNSSSPAVLNIIVSTQDNQVLPNGLNLPYIQADPKYWQSTVNNPAPPENTNFAVYSFEQVNPLPANQERTVQFYNEFDILLYQNVWAGVSLQRNAHLLSDIGTNAKFIYQTPEVRFSAPIVPLINRRGQVHFSPELSFGNTLSQQLQNYFNNLFTQLFGTNPATNNWMIELACRYAYSLLEKDPDAYFVNVPIVFHTQWQLSLNDGGLNQFVTSLVQNILLWLQTNHITLKTTAAFNFDISIFSPQALNRPILHLHNVYVPCFPSPIQTQRILPPTLPSDPPDLVNVDGVNPLVTDINQNTNILPNTTTPALLAYGDPVRVKSWISGMVWADNATLYYTGSDSIDQTTTTISRQQPVYADPLIGLYVCQLSGDDPNYNDYFSQSDQTNENDMSVYGDAGWQPGFHLSMPNPALNVAAAYNSGQGPNTYNNDALVYNAGNNGQPWQPPTGTWVAASAASDTNTNPSNYSVNTPPASAYQVGLCQYGCWRDTLSVAPATSNNDGTFSLAFAPPAARLVKQSDFHAEFLMANETANAPNQALKMTMTQGSPFSQFVAAGVDAVRVAGIFKPPMPAGYVLTPGAISTQNTISGLDDEGSINYVIIYQQVNFFNMEKTTTEPPAQRMNWVAFAVYWDPTTTNLTLDPENDMALYLTFTNPAQDNYFVIAGLPSQFANQFNPATQPFSMSLAQPWANEIGQYAFNFITDTHVAYYVGQDKKGQPTAANQVKTYYQWQFQPCGPVLTTDTSVMLLQPHHYASFCDGRNSSVLDNPLNFIHFGTHNKYWISRGKLEALVGAEFSTTYIYPNILPYLPYFNTLDVKPDSNNQNTYNLAAMAAAMSGYDWVVEFPSADGEQQNGPATTSMANTAVMQDSYNAVKGFLKAAKLITLLLQMAKTHYFDNEAVMSSIDGTLKTASPPGDSIYGVGNRAISATETETFTPGGALHDFIKHLMEAYSYYFNFNPSHLAQNFAHDSLLAKSYYYSYYDNSNHHLFVYPAAGAGSNSWPTNVETAGPRYDGYGTVSMLNDHAYTYGYLITAAGILGLVLKDPALQQLQYQPFNLATQSMDDAQAVCSAQEWQDWSSWLSNWTPIIDQLVMDIAYDPNLKGADGFQMLPGLTYPKMEFFDPWSGAAWTDGFLTSGSIQGHNVNSPWEEMQAWAGILLWGHATGRSSIVNLGVYLYTTAFYSLEAYHYNTIKTYVPQEIGSDYGGYDSYLPKATNDFYPGFDMSWNSIYTPLANAKQAFTGKTMWDTMMSDTLPHQTAHVTYFYQGNVRSDTTYWNSPVGLQMTAIFPHTAYTLAMIRSHAYMIDWANAIQFQNSRSYYKVPYPTFCNLLYAELGLNFVVAANDCSGEYITQTYPSATGERTTLPIPCAETSPDVYSIDYGPRNNPGNNDVATNPAKNSFYYLVVDNTQTPYAWFWQKCSALNTYQSSGDKTNPPWISVSNCVTLSTYLSTADQSATEALLYFYHYDRYGTLDFTVYASATPLIPETPIIQPMSMVWIKNRIRSFIIYNTNPTEISVSFYLFGNPQTISTQVVSANSMLVWPTAAIYSFTASESVITSGEQVTLSWDVRDAAELTLSNGADVNLSLNQAAGTTIVNPTPGNPTYTLTLIDVNGYQYQSQITFEFIAIQLFNIQPMYVVPNSMVTLTWQVSGAEKITITNGADYNFSSTDAIGNTSAQATLTNPNFTLTLYPSNTEVTPPTQTITVEFIQILSFTATPQEIAPGGTVTLAWQVTGATNITISNNGSIVTQSTEATGSFAVQPTAQNPTYILTLYPEGPGSFTLTQQVTIDFFQIISFTATPNEIETGDSVTLNWQVSPGNNKGISITNNAGFNFQSPAAMGSTTTQPTAANPIYTLTLIPSDAGVQPLTQNLTIVFPQIQSFTATPSTIEPSNSSTLAWQVVGAAKINVSDGADFNQDSTDASGSFTVSPTVTTIYTLTLYPTNNNLNNLQATATITVQA